ncbi:MobQ family relaxase [Cereibacter sphaeroides]|uniref:MobQ family relaxase n=1 Tax=Cereibacter sphaeroides TaxID=1063 RepID=UPI00313CF8A4
MADGAIFHLDVRTVSRSDGRSAVAAAAYRSASRLHDARTGLTHDFARKRGVLTTFIAAPDGCDWITDRDTLWNAAEAAEKRKNSTVAREWLVALPDALDATQRADLARALAVELAQRFGVAVDVAIHAASGEGDQRNHHAHLLTTTRTAGPDGLGDKTRVLDAAKTGGAEIYAMRAWWAGTVNDALAAAQSSARVDHRRIAVIAADARAEAEALEKQAKAVETLNAKPADAGGLWKGLGSAARAIWEGGMTALKSTAETANELREKANELRQKAARYTRATEPHHGPVLTAFLRRMAPVWAEQAKAEEARRAAQEAAQRALMAERAEQARKAKEASEAARRAATAARETEEARERCAREVLPLIRRARHDPITAEVIKREGIDLDRPDQQVARDPIWLMAGRQDQAHPVWLIVHAYTAARDRHANLLARIEAKTAAQIAAAAKPKPKPASPAPTEPEPDPDPPPRRDWGGPSGP